MRALVAPDKFKGSLSAAEAAAAIARGIHRALPRAEVDLFPMSDGGEGFVEAMIAVAGGKILRRRVCGPMGKPVLARFGLLPNRVAVLEMAEASGLHLVPLRQRNPLKTTTFGTGQLIRAAMNLGCRKILVGLGGSATTDAGAGMAQALGWKFLDAREREIHTPLAGGDLHRICRIESPRSRFLSSLSLLAACDVTHPLLGPRGAARVFGPQKGATPAMIARLEKNLRHFARLVSRTLRPPRCRAWALVTFPGAGAAGGLGFGLRVFLGAEFESGATLLMRYGRFDQKLRRADLVITGEGKLDAQTLCGKAPARVAWAAKRFGLPVLALAGSVSASPAALRRCGMDLAVAIRTKTMSLDYTMKHAAQLLEAASARMAVNFLR